MLRTPPAYCRHVGYDSGMKHFHRFCMRIILTQEALADGRQRSWRQAWSEAGRMLR